MRTTTGGPPSTALLISFKDGQSMPWRNFSKSRVVHAKMGQVSHAFIGGLLSSVYARTCFDRHLC